MRRVGFAEEDDLVAVDLVAHDLLEELAVILVDLAGHDQPAAEFARDGDRVLRPFLRREAADEQEILALFRLKREGLDIDRVVHVPHITR